MGWDHAHKDEESKKSKPSMANTGKVRTIEELKSTNILVEHFLIVNFTIQSPYSKVANMPCTPLHGKECSKPGQAQNVLPNALLELVGK